MERWEGAIRNGTRDPHLVALSPEQKLAIGWLHPFRQEEGVFCSATLIAPHVVATASHCISRQMPGDIAFAVGDTPDDALTSVQVGLFHDHPRLDTALLVLTDRLTDRVRVDPIPVFPYAIDRSFEGMEVDGAGFGETMDRTRDGRWFAALLLARVNPTDVVVDGRGRQGMCFGDSGGPILLQDDEGLLGLLATESAGDETCLDQDHAIRLDNQQEFVEEALAIEPPERPVDPCEGIDELGICEGDVAARCRGGRVERVDCAALGAPCGWASDQAGNTCLCGEGLDYLGRCDGDVATYCEEGALRVQDCARRRRVCTWVNDDTGYFCARNANCGPEDERCEGAVSFHCQGVRLLRDDCAASGQECEVGAEGPTCVAPPPEEPEEPPVEPEEPPVEPEEPIDEPDAPPADEPDDGEGLDPGASLVPTESGSQQKLVDSCATTPARPGSAWPLLLLGVGGAAVRRRAGRGTRRRRTT